MNKILPVICNGYCLIQPFYVNEDEWLISMPFTTDDVAKKEGWTTTTNRKFSMDGKSVVWLCPKCNEKWKEERQLRIDEIMRLVFNQMTEREFWNLINELYSLDATTEEKDKFSKLLFPERIK